MGDFAVSATFASSRSLGTGEVKQLFVDEMQKDFSKVKLREKRGETIVTGRVKTGGLNPVVSFKGKLVVESRPEKARLRFDAAAKTNFWFWLTFCLFLALFFPLLIALIFMFTSQKTKIASDLDQVVQRMQFALDEW